MTLRKMAYLCCLGEQVLLLVGGSVGRCGRDFASWVVKL